MRQDGDQIVVPLLKDGVRIEIRKGKGVCRHFFAME